MAYEPPEDAPEDKEFGDDVARREPERLALARVVADERRETAAAAKSLGLWVAQVLGKLADEGRHIAELGDPAEPRKWRDRVVSEPFFDDRKGEIPRFRPDFVGEPEKGL
jgi:hypothetical protein